MHVHKHKLIFDDKLFRNRNIIFNINAGFLNITDAPCFSVSLYAALTNLRLIWSRYIWSSFFIFYTLTKCIHFDEFGPYLRWFILQWKFSMYHKLILVCTCFSPCYNIIHDIIICYFFYFATSGHFAVTWEKSLPKDF